MVMFLMRGIMYSAAVVDMLHQNMTKVIGRFRHGLAAVWLSKRSSKLVAAPADNDTHAETLDMSPRFLIGK
jgi:hypothetical protein